MSKALYPITHYYIDGGGIDTDYNLRIFMDDDIYREFKKENLTKSIVTIWNSNVIDLFGSPLKLWRIVSAESINHKREWIIYCDSRLLNEKFSGQIIVHNRYLEVIKE